MTTMWTPLDILSLESWLLLATTVVLIRYYIHRRWQVLKDLGIPHDPPSILNIGNARTMFSAPQEFFKQDLPYKKKFGKVHGTYIGIYPRITVWDPNILKKVQIKEFSNFSERQAHFRKVQGELNNGLFLSSGEQWRRMRHTLTPTFSTSKLKEMLGIFVQCTDNLIKNLKIKAKQRDGKFDSKEVLGRLSLDVVCSAAFGVDIYSREEEKEEPKVLVMARKLFKASLVNNPFFLLFMLFPATEDIASYFNYSVFPKSVTNYFSSLVNLMIRRKQDQGEKARVDLLKCMLDCETDKKNITPDMKAISREEVVGNSMLMLLAGYDTTSSAMQLLVYNLAVHKECQEKLRQEIKDTVDKYGGLTYEALNDMKYLMMCINESLRIYPPAVRNGRLCQEDIIIDGMKIPKGAHVDIPLYGMLRDPEYWDEPLKFKPERMEDMSKIDPIMFQPFGVGPRSCIAMRFALMEVKMAISKILLNFRLDVADDTPKPPVDIIFLSTMTPKVDPLNLRVNLLNDDGDDDYDA